TLDAGMAVVGLAAFRRHHANDFRAFHFRAEGTAHAAVGAGGFDGVLGRAVVDYRVFVERGGGAGLYAGAAGHALGIKEGFADAGADLGVEAAALDGQRERTLDVFAGAHAARTHDALARLEGEVRVALVLGRVEVVGAVIAVAHFAQTHGTGHVLQFAVAVGGTGQAVERMVGDVKLHDPFAQLGQLAVLGGDLEAGFHRRGAGGRRAAAAFDFHQA